MRSIVIDTNIIIYHLHGIKNWQEIFNELYDNKIRIFISTVTEMELFSFSKMNVKEKKTINELLDALEIVPVDSRLARIAGYIRQDKKISTADILIAATAKSLDIPLLTNNIKHFQGVRGVKVVNTFSN